MLVLKRKADQSVEARVPGGPSITVTVLEVVGKQVRLGFTAPGGVPIHRSEVWARLDAGDERDPVILEQEYDLGGEG